MTLIEGLISVCKTDVPSVIVIQKKQKPSSKSILLGVSGRLAGFMPTGLDGCHWDSNDWTVSEGHGHEQSPPDESSVLVITTDGFSSGLWYKLA